MCTFWLSMHFFFSLDGVSALSPSSRLEEVQTMFSFSEHKHCFCTSQFLLILFLFISSSPFDGLSPSTYWYTSTSHAHLLLFPACLFYLCRCVLAASCWIRPALGQ